MFRHIKKDSIIHRIEPVSKLIIIIGITLLTFMTENPIYLGLIMLLPCILLLLARLPGALIPNPCLLVFIIVLSWLVRGVEGAIFISLRFMTIFYCAELFSLTTEPKDFAYSLERTGMPFPMVFVISTSLRILPILEEELEKIKDSQVSRGLDLETRNPIKRIKNTMPLMVPLIRNSLHRAHEMALALESRGFRNAQFVRH